MFWLNKKYALCSLSDKNHDDSNTYSMDAGQGTLLSVGSWDL